MSLMEDISQLMGPQRFVKDRLTFYSTSTMGSWTRIQL